MVLIDMVDVIEDVDRCVLGNSLSLSLSFVVCISFLVTWEFVLPLLCVSVLRKCSASDALIFAGGLATLHGTLF